MMFYYGFIPWCMKYVICVLYSYPLVDFMQYYILGR